MGGPIPCVPCVNPTRKWMRRLRRFLRKRWLAIPTRVIPALPKCGEPCVRKVVRPLLMSSNESGVRSRQRFWWPLTLAVGRPVYQFSRIPRKPRAGLCLKRTRVVNLKKSLDEERGRKRHRVSGSQSRLEYERKKLRGIKPKKTLDGARMKKCASGS